jgi:hypothetical protein
MFFGAYLPYNLSEDRAMIGLEIINGIIVATLIIVYLTDKGEL